MNRSIRRATTALAMGVLMAASSVAAEVSSRDSSLAIDTIPFKLESQLAHGAASIAGKTLVLQAGKGTDLYANHDGSERADRTPRVLFEPAGDFILQARVSAQFRGRFDGGALIVHAGEGNWGKLLFERGPDGKAGISSTVAKGSGDDAHHGERSGSETWLKVARRKDMFVFYTATDGKDWRMVRSFGMPPGARIKVGFSSQAPVGDSFTARFSDISFRKASFQDFWRGE